MRKPEVLRFDPDAEYFTDEGCYILEFSNTTRDKSVSIARARVEAGVTTRLHRLHGQTERYLILAGQGLVEVGDLAPTTVNPGDVVLIPPLCPQRITNTGPADLVFLAICSPRFRPAHYEDIDAQR